MKLNFIYLGSEPVYVSPKNQMSYFKFNAMMDSGVGSPKFCVVETDESGSKAMSKLKVAVQYAGNFDIKPSFERKAPQLFFVDLVV